MIVLKSKYNLFLLLILLISTKQLNAQNNSSAFKQFFQVSRYERCWAVKHLFIANRAWKVTRYVRLVTDSVAKTKILDGDIDGGQVDAFRHAYWMAILVQNMYWKKAFRLGVAHEKGNYLDYKKHRKEETQFPDKVSSDMDLYNNNVGIEIGKEIVEKNPTISADSIKQIVISYILKGRMKVIKKNKKGEFLDANNNVIKTESLIGKWENEKVLVSSDFVR